MMSAKFTQVLFLCFILFLIEIVDGTLTVLIEGKLVIPDGTVASNYDITLNGDLYSTLTRFDGSFTFHEIPSGIYLLDVQSIKEMFPQMKIKVSAEDGSITVVEYKYHGAKRVPSTYPLVVTAIAQIDYFQPRPPFNLMGMIMGNPMMLVMLLSAVVVIGMPKLLSGMTPEELAEMKKTTAGGPAGGDPMKQFAQLLGGKAAGTDSGHDEDED